MFKALEIVPTPTDFLVALLKSAISVKLDPFHSSLFAMLLFEAFFPPTANIYVELKCPTPAI